jgi:hypothetical protein
VEDNQRRAVYGQSKAGAPCASSLKSETEKEKEKHGEALTWCSAYGLGAIFSEAKLSAQAKA